MNKGLEALKEYRNQQIGINVYADDYLEIIEKELEQAEKDREMLDVFKNALTVEHKPTNNIHAFKKDRENCFTSFVSEIIEIKQNELDEKLCKSLREWVLKNAFPKELKALEIIKNKKVDIKDIYKYENHLQYNYNYLGLSWDYRLTQEEFNLLKEVCLWN